VVVRWSSVAIGKAEEVERFRFAEPELGTLRRCEATERDQPGLLRRRKLPPSGAAALLHNLFRRLLHQPGFQSHLRSFNGYDGPEILPSSTRPFCLIGGDAEHSALTGEY
jgi:hypothetical protein